MNSLYLFDIILDPAEILANSGSVSTASEPCLAPFSTREEAEEFLYEPRRMTPSEEVDYPRTKEIFTPPENETLHSSVQKAYDAYKKAERFYKENRHRVDAKDLRNEAKKLKKIWKELLKALQNQI